MNNIEPQPHRASSVYYAIGSAPEASRLRLSGLYAVHRKWCDVASSRDEHQAITTLNWWHHELEACQKAQTSHPALRAMQSELWRPECAQTLQQLLHGHMHWQHLNRVEDLAQLQPTIDAIGGQLAHIWLLMCGAEVPSAFTQSAGRVLWWIDQLRHLGHNLSNERVWIPMQWLKECDVPAHILLKTEQPAHERAQQLAALIQKIIAQIDSECAQYQKQYALLSKQQKNDVRSWHVLIQLRQDLLRVIRTEPEDLFNGLVSIAPLRKWWRVVRT
jgi:phytoene/squalene synthetase